MEHHTLLPKLVFHDEVRKTSWYSYQERPKIDIAALLQLLCGLRVILVFWSKYTTVCSSLVVLCRREMFTVVFGVAALMVTSGSSGAKPQRFALVL